MLVVILLLLIRRVMKMRSPFKKVIDETDLSRRDLAEILGCDLEVLNQEMDL